MGTKGFGRSWPVVLWSSVAMGCGAANVLSSSDESVADRARPSPLGAFADSVNVSRVEGLESAYESQSAAAVLGDRVFIAYRAEDPALTRYGQAANGGETQSVCWGASQLAVSTGDPRSGFERRRVPVPAGMALLWGPVAVTRFRDRVIASALASPDERFAELAGEDGCLTASSAPGTAASVPASGALTAACLMSLTDSAASCVAKRGAMLEGGSLAATDRELYAAYRDAKQGSVVLFRSSNGERFVELPVPATGVDGEVLLAATRSRLFLVYAAGSEVRLLRYDEEHRDWEPGLVVTSAANRRHVPSRPLRPALGVPRFTVGMLEGDPPELAVFWQRRSGRGRTSVQGALCETGRGGTCRSPRHLFVAKARDNFLPSVVSVAQRGKDGNMEYRHLLSYWRDTRTKSGRVGLHFAEFDGRRLRSRWRTLQTQQPCALQDPAGADWGTSDASFVLGQGSPAPVVYRAFTDSSLGQCDARVYRASPQHISVIPLPSF